MRILHALAFFTPVAAFIACSSGGAGTPSIGGPPGGFGQAGGVSSVLGPGGVGTGQTSNPTADTGTGTHNDTGTSTPKDTGTVVVDTGSSASFDNYNVCSAWVDTINTLPCVPTPYEPSAMGCTHTKSACDLTSFYDCLSAAYTCKDSGGTSVLDTSGASSCKATCGGG